MVSEIHHFLLLFLLFYLIFDLLLEEVIYLNMELPEGTLLRTLDPDYEEGKIRDTGR